MKTNYSAFFLLCFTQFAIGQYAYDPSPEHPYGLPNPEAPQELLDFAPLIGECNCTSVSRNPDQSWGNPVEMIWRFKYIMNGLGVQDETLKADGKHSGSIRQFVKDSTRWYVHYYSSGSPSTTLPVWEGNKSENEDIVLYRKQKAPNGLDGFYKITFSEIEAGGFKWLGEWVNADESISYPTWKIDCTKKTNPGYEIEKQSLLNTMKEFSKAYIAGDYEAIADAYTSDGKIFPNNASIIEGKEAIKKRWILPKGESILHHEFLPEEINILGTYAFDYGFYKGRTKTKEGKEIDFKGKYVVVWKKIDAEWKMYLDIWNRVAD
jgi:ketosteroid isomerase-like protein